MFTRGLRQTKYIYPSLLLLFLLMLLLKFALAHGAEPGAAEEAVQPLYQTGERSESGRTLGHREDDFIAAVDGFNRMMANGGGEFGFLPGRPDSLEARLLRLDEQYAALAGGERDKVAGYYDETSPEENGLENALDSRYSEAKRQLTERRNREADAYQDSRRQLESRLNGISRYSPDHDRLEQALNDLDRRYAERERTYERDFRDMDTDFSLARW